jgi:integrase
MNKARKTGKGWPRRVYMKNDAWYFYAPEKMRCPKTGKEKSWIHLAYKYQGEPAMLAALAALLSDKKIDQGSMPYVCAEFKASKLKKYSTETQAQYKQYIDVIADDFEEFYFAQITTKNCADFLRNNFKDKPNTAQKYSALMRKLFKFGISELGLRQDNPIDQLDLGDYETARRTVLPTHEQVRKIRDAGMHSKARKDTGKQLPTASGPMFACIIDMTYLAWQRGKDIRTLREDQITAAYIGFKPSKTEKTSGKSVNILITPQIQAVIDKARAIKKKYGIISPYLFPTQKGKPYTKSGLFSMWKRARERAGLEDVDIVFKDLRALGATDALKAGMDKRDIQTRMVHASGDTTEIYFKEAVPDVSKITMDLPWNSSNLESDN